jgi:hypothetical protein
MRHELEGIPDLDPEVAERVSRGIDHFQSTVHGACWARAIVIAEDRFGSFDVATPGQRPYEIVTGVPYKLGHAKSVSMGYSLGVYEEPAMLRRAWLEAARVAVMRVEA